MAIIAVADYKTFKGITASTWDTQLAEIVPMVIEWAEDYTSRTFEKATHTEKVCGRGNHWLFVSSPPISSVTSITYTDNSGGTTTVASTSYRPRLNDDHSGQIMRLSDAFDEGYETSHRQKDPRWIDGFDNYTVVYVGGWESSGAGGDPLYPAKLRMILYQLVDVVLAKALQDQCSSLMESENMGSYGYKRPAITIGGYSDVLFAHATLLKGWQRDMGGVT